MKRKALFLGAAFLCGALCATAAEKAPFRVIFSNDTTNLLSCPSPFRPDRHKPITDDDIRASVIETAGQGIDVHMLQPGLGWVPWWPSQFLPMARYVAWKKARGEKPDAYENYVLNGGDMVRVFIDQCRASGETPFLSIRMNDVHHIYRGRGVQGDAAAQEKAMEEFPLFADHPEYRIGPEMKGSMRYAFDWSHPEVREYKYRLLEELCRNYDFEGLELDFMRAPYLFNPVRSSLAQRRQIVTEFVGRVRRLLDETAKPGAHRWLCVRVPGYPQSYDEIGVDLPALAEAGADMINASGYYFTDMQMDLPAIRKALPDSVALYSEVHFATAIAAKPPTGDALNRHASREELETAAHLAYVQGADGISVFNFQYYRGTYGKTDVGGEGAEPPYSVFKVLRDPAALARLPQDYFWGCRYFSPDRKPEPFHTLFHSGEVKEQSLILAPPEGGWQQDGRLRIQAKASLGKTLWRATLNGVSLEPDADVSAPHAEYPVAIGKPEDYRAWKVPLSAVKEGVNRLRLGFSGEGEADLEYLQLWLP
ncbi:MAG: hypothetical protein PW734_09715 [Verrucomicrobium sp.]|nr:hypothetical protein [Verrucomicrobium sp.]